MIELLERDGELEVLQAALRDGLAGTGSIVLVHGEAGIGKTSLVRAFLQAAPRHARLLRGGCDDLLTPRPFGPLREAFTGCRLAEALARDDRDAVLTDILVELSHPAVLVVEDVHWADDATLDVLRFVGRRVERLPLVLLLTYRDDEVGRDHPLPGLLAAFSGQRVWRVAMPRLSRAAVAHLAGGTAATSAPLFALTGGNPFFVTEALAAPTGSVPATVADAVLARIGRLDEAARSALDQLAVIPTRTPLPLAWAVLGELGMLAEGERLGMVEVSQDAVAFRHELARRAVEDALPHSVRMVLHARVLAVLRECEAADPAQVVHHAVAAGDEAVALEYVPLAAARANRAGAFGQEVALYEQALVSRGLAPATRAGMQEARATALYTLDRTGSALSAAREAVALRRQVGEPGPLASALITLAPILWAVAMPHDAVATVRQAVGLLAAGGESPSLALALCYSALLQVTVDADEEAVDAGREAAEMAQRLGDPVLQELSAIAVANARVRTGDMAGLADLRRVTAAAAAAEHETVMIGYVLTIENLWQLGRYTDLDAVLDEASDHARQRELRLYRDYLAAYRARARVRQGAWEETEAQLRGLADKLDDQQAALRYVLPELARLLVRRGAPDAEAVLGRAVELAGRTVGRHVLLPAVLAQLERSWLTGRTEESRVVAGELLGRCERSGRERERGELLRWLARCGTAAAPFDGCPEEFAAGLRGDWRTAAAAWERRGAHYERALELLDSGQIDPTLEALAVLDELGALPAARIARQRLRALGVRQIPRGPRPASRANPAGLTGRQVEILRLLADGLTNAEIAARLVVSVRTVDHHVSAVLQKLGVAGRREAAAASAELGLMGNAEA